VGIQTIVYILSKITREMKSGQSFYLASTEVDDPLLDEVDNLGGCLVLGDGVSL
jgi:hypothetical protein